MKINQHDVGHMTKMAATSIYDKTLQKISPEPVDRFPCYLLCSIGNSGLSWFVRPARSNLRNLRFSVGKSATCDLKLIELMKICEY